MLALPAHDAAAAHVFGGERDREKHAKRRAPTVVEDEEQSDEPAATAADEAEAEPDADEEATE